MTWPRPDQRAAAALIRINLRLVVTLRLWGRVRVHGLENVPPVGPLLVVSNHLGGGDPPLLFVVVRRRLRFLAMSDLFRIPVVRYLIRACGAISVRRSSADRTALKSGLAVLRAGGALVIYPEGERSVDARLDPFHNGASFLALAAGVIILPVGMAGSERILPRLPTFVKQRGIDIRFGLPFTLPTSMTDRRQATALIRARVEELLPVDYR